MSSGGNSSNVIASHASEEERERSRAAAASAEERGTRRGRELQCRRAGEHSGDEQSERRGDDEAAIAADEDVGGGQRVQREEPGAGREREGNEEQARRSRRTASRFMQVPSTKPMSAALRVSTKCEVWCSQRTSSFGCATRSHNPSNGRAMCSVHTTTRTGSEGALGAIVVIRVAARMTTHARMFGPVHRPITLLRRTVHGQLSGSGRDVGRGRGRVDPHGSEVEIVVARARGRLRPDDRTVRRRRRCAHGLVNDEAVATEL